MFFIQYIYSNVSLLISLPSALCYLPQFLIQVRCVDHSSLPQLLIKHFIVPHNKVGAQELLHLHSDIHGHGNDVVEKNHEGQKVCERPD